MKGIISALGVSRDGVVAVGTLSRWVGLYDSNGAGGCVGVFPLSSGGGQSGNGGSGREGEEDVAGSGLGITNVEFSPDGTYLYVAERMSDGILVYDIRVQGRSLGVLRGRKAVTNQRMGFEVVGAGAGSGDESEESHEIWAGGTDGSVRVWRNPHRTEGVADPDEEWWAHDGTSCAIEYL